MPSGKIWQRPSFILALILTIVFLMFGVSNLFGPGSGVTHWVIGVVCAMIIVGLWIAAFRGAHSLKESAQSLRDQGREVRQNFDRDR